MAHQTIHLTPSDDGRTLGEVLKFRLAPIEWKTVSGLIKQRHVSLHGNLCIDPQKRLRQGDVIRISEAPASAPATVDTLSIVFQDTHLLIVDKPAGLSSTREASDHRQQKQATLDELLRERFPTASPRGLAARGPSKTEAPRASHPLHATKPPAKRMTRESPRPTSTGIYPVHRLDRDTSGLMLFARTLESQATLESMFRRHELTRKYHAIVHGHPKQQTIQTHLIRDRGDGLRGSGSGEDAQLAVTHLTPLEALGNYERIECVLKTGRTHQIRIHLAEIGHMLCGERTYIRPLNGPATRDDSDAPRQALHAFHLSFVHPVTQHKLSFESPWPRDLQRWIESIKPSPSGRVLGEGRAAKDVT